MARNRRPRLSWFRFYADDFAGGTAALTAPECGRYLLLLLAQWASKERRAIPREPERLAVICRGEAPGPAVLAKFVRVEDGLRNLRLADEWDSARQEFEGKGGAHTAPDTATHTAPDTATHTGAHLPTIQEPRTKIQEQRATSQENGPSVADATGRSTASRARQRPLFGEEESKEAAMLVKGWVYLVAPNGKAPPPSPGIIRAVATLQEAGYSKPQRALAVVAASTERYYREMRGLRGLQVALSLGGRPRVKDGLVLSLTKNHPEGLLNEPRRYSPLAEKVLVGLGAMDEASARGWRPE